MSQSHLICLPTAADALAARGQDGFAWLNLCQPTRDELAELAEPLGLHALSIEDCFDANQVPKIEDYPEHAFLLFNTASYPRQELTIHEIDAFLGADFLITVSGRDAAGQPVLTGMERAVEADYASARLGPALLLHVVLDYIIDQQFAAVEAIEERLNEAEDLILADGQRFNPADLLHLRRDLLTLRKGLFHEREILVKICRKDCPFIPEAAIYQYRDIYDHLTQFFELSEAAREMVTNLMEMYLSILSNQMAKAANDTNATVRRLTFITTIFMPLTLLAGIGGMSEWTMMTGADHWRLAYPAFIIAMIILGVADYYLLKWIEKKGRQTDGVSR